MIEPSVAIILLNWNSLDDTIDCLKSIDSLEYKNRIAIVVDNGSRDDPQEVLNQFPNTVLVKNDSNVGFAGGNNIGFMKAHELGCDYCWVLNNDAVVEPDSLTALVDALDQNPNLAAITHLITYYYQPELSWFAGGVFKSGLPAIRGYFEPVGDRVPKCNLRAEETEYLCGCSFLARIEAIRAVNGFDEAYFCYVEDVDLSLMLKKKGYKIGYTPNAAVAHKVSRSSGNQSPLKLYYKHRNMLYFIRKHEFQRSVRLRWWMVSMRTIASLVIKRGKYKAAWNLWRGLLDGEFNKMGKSARF